MNYARGVRTKIINGQLTMQQNMQTKKKWPLWFTSMAQRFGTWKRRRSGQTVPDDKLIVYRLFNDCTDLPLSNFIECICNDDFTALVADGDCPSLAVLQDRWLTIYSQFIELSHETDVIHMRMLMQNVIVLKARIAKIHTCVNVINLLGSVWDEMGANDEAKELMDTAVESLRKLNYRYKYDPAGASFYNDLNSVLSRCKQWEVELEMREAEIDAINEKNKGEKISAVYFTTNLVRMSQHFKFMINSRDVTTAEYCIMKRDYVDYVNQMNNAKR